MPSISVILPVFNSSEYIEDCIESILNQTFQDFEIVVIDDGSTDNTVELIRAMNHPKINLLQNEHHFIQSLNKGVEAAEGKYLARMDSDDWMFPDRLKVQYDFMEENPQIDVCGSWSELFGASEGQVKLVLHHEQIVSSLILHSPLIHPSILMKKNLVCKFSSGCLYNPDYAYAEDYKLWTELAIKGARFANIPEPLIKYRVSEKQVTYLHHDQMKKTSAIIQKEYIDSLFHLFQEKMPSTTRLIKEITDLYDSGNISHNCFQKLAYSLYSEFPLLNN